MAEQSYELMHKDDVVASLQLDDLSGAILKVTLSASPELLPLGGSQGTDSLRKWWLRRAVPIRQGNIAALLQQEGHTVTPGPWPGALVVEFAGSPAASAAFKKGLFHVQGLASQFAALCVDAQPGQQVLDLCAAPGGKSLTLAEAMQDKGQLVSGEFVPARVPLLQQAFDRCGITCAVAVENDATQHNSDWPTFDRVLCDVPCSGLGVIAKKPDIRYKDLDGIENLLAAQQKILQNGADSLAENGRLVYSTCTVNDKENQAQVEKFLSANPDFHVVLPKTALPGADITPLGTLFLPHRTGTDGFFAAILERN